MGDERICVAAIAGAFGVKGDVRIKSFCAEPSAFADYGALSSEAGDRTFKVTLSRAVKGGFAALIDGVKTRDQAEALRGQRLYAPRSALPVLPDDEYYYSDLIGLSVSDTGGELIGKVQSVQDFGAGDILEIAPVKGGSSLLLPFTRDIVPTVDLASARIVVDPPKDMASGSDKND